jgi:Arc/MetJ family transcription regulator
MRTNIVLEDSLVKEALRHSGIKTKKELIHKALEEFVKNRRRLNLLDLAGKIEFAEGYDYKSLRMGKNK